MKAIKRYLRVTDIWYLLLCMLCSALSVLVLLAICYDNSGAILGEGSSFKELFNVYRIAVVQLGASGLGFICAILLSLVDYRSMVNFWPVHMALTWGLVALTFLRTGPFGKAPAGTDNFSWIMLPAGLSLQPTELAKISFIMTFAMHLDNVHAHINEPRTLLKLLLHMGVPVLIVHFQGDDGSALVFLAIGCMMLFAGGLSFRYILSAVALGAVTVPVLLLTGKFKSYQFDRIAALFNPEAYEKIMYQQNQARVAIGAGQISGRGLFSGEHFYVPLAQNDFIFSFMAEAFGFLGSMLVIGMLFAIAIKTLTTALRAQDRVGSYICIGVFATLAWQIIVNLGMNLTLLPVIGVTLPFFSAGGTSVLMLYLCVGLVLSVYTHNKKTLFDR